MESNGKSFNINNELVKNSSYLLFGGYGPKCQHSFFQSLFQGSENINTYFIALEPPLNGVANLFI